MAICFSFSKLLLFTLDFFFVIVGLIVAVIGIWALVDSPSFFETVAFFAKTKPTMFQLYYGTSVVMISSSILVAIGVIVFIISFCGCWGVVSENRFLLITYASLMSFIVCAEVISVILLFALNPQWQALVNEKMVEQFSKNYRGAVGVYPVTAYSPFSLAFDAVMIEFKCCGVNGPGDFDNATEWITNGRRYIGDGVNYTGSAVKLPVACCKFTDTKFFKNQQYARYLENMVSRQCPVTPEAYHNTSCANIIPGELNRNKIPMIVIPVILLALELLCIGLASFMANRIKRFESAVFY